MDKLLLSRGGIYVLGKFFIIHDVLFFLTPKTLLLGVVGEHRDPSLHG